jgi:hypothetical protein
MKYLLEYAKYTPESEYKIDSRRELDLDRVRKLPEYGMVLDLGFKDVTSHQQELNNTLKFTRTTDVQREKGHGRVFYTIHPTGIVRRYNPVKNRENPSEMDQGNGNDLKDFGKPFKKVTDYTKGLKYLWQYLKRKEEKGDYR